MKKSYFFVHNGFVGTQEKVRDILNGMPSIIYWRFDMPYLFYVVSESSARDLSAEFEIRANLSAIPNAKYVFTEYTGNAQGRLTQGSWHLLNSKDLLKEGS